MGRPRRGNEAFSSWFGDADGFELIDGTVGEVGGRLHLSWRFRLRPAPFGIGDSWHVIEQQAYADAGETIDALDLLCSGFHPGSVAPDPQARILTAPACKGAPKLPVQAAPIGRP